MPFRECTIKLSFKILLVSIHRLFLFCVQISSRDSRHFFNFPFKQIHGSPTLLSLDSIKYFVTQRLGNTLDEVLHFLLCVHHVIDVEKQVWILKELIILGRETFFEIWHEVCMFQVLANMLFSLYDQIAEDYFWNAVLFVLSDLDESLLIGLYTRVCCKEIVIDHERIQRLLNSHNYILWTQVLVGEIVEAERPRRIAIKDWHQVLIEFVKSLWN